MPDFAFRYIGCHGRAGRSGWPMIFAAFIVVLPLPPGQPIAHGLPWALDWAGVLVFLILFAKALDAARKGLPALWIVRAMTLMGLAFAPFNPGSTILFAYAAALVPWFVAGDTRRTAAGVALIIAVLSCEVWIAGLSLPFWLTTCAWCVIAAGSYLWVVKMLSRIDRLAKVAEQERIARDLHDVLGHTLSLITLKAELAGQVLDEAAEIGRARREIADVESISRSALAEVRQTIRGYRIETLQAELERVAAMLRTAGITMSCESETMRLDSVRDVALCMALREAVTNVVRHAGARNCHIRVQKAEDVCLLEVHDDGAGTTHSEGQGLRGMRERIEALGGSVLLAHSNGTRVTVRVPVPS